MTARDEQRRRFSTFEEMFQARPTSSANRKFIAQAFENLDVTEIVETKAYVKVVRGSGVDLRIYRGIISGYASEQEALELSGAPHAALSVSRPGSWWVNLPDRAASAPARVVRGRARDKGPTWMRMPCPTCRYLMTEDRVCTNCA